MGRLIALLLGGFGLGAYLRRRRRPGLEPSPADELKAKLAESRATTPAADAPVETEAVPEPEATLADDLEARRREVHERARGAIDDLS